MPINLSTLVNQTNSLQLAKAWVNFNGTTATPSTIRSSYNVSSVTKNGTGDYTVNFATAMVDANYSVSFGIIGASGSGGYIVDPILNTQSTSSCRVQTVNGGNIAIGVDVSIVSVQIFGN